jgi:subtilase family serine protease
MKRHLALSRKYGSAIIITAFLSLFIGTRQILDGQSKTPAVHNRLGAEISNKRRVALKDNLHPLAKVENDVGEVNDSLPLQRMTLVLQMTDAQHASLRQLLADQQTRSSGSFHKWLTPEEYADRFGVTERDAERIKTWLEREGFASVEIAKSRARILFSGTAGQAKNAFLAPIHRYQLNGVEHYANASAPFIPNQLSGLVSQIRGLNDFHPRPHAVRARKASPAASPHFTSSISGSNFVTPADFATIYNVKSLYNAGIDGTGQKIAIAGQTDIDVKDIQAFRSAAGLAPNDPQVVLYGTDPGTITNDLGEADLDIEWAGAVARNATIIYVNSSDVFTSAMHAIDDNLAPVLSLTYGTCEANAGAADINTLTTAFEQANAQGMTVVAAAGDFGAADCDQPSDSNRIISSATQGLAIDVPGDIPNVTAIGGTEFNEGTGTFWSTTNDANNGSALSYINEKVWNDSSTSGGIAATGGGVSKFFTKPGWQTGENVPNDGFRDTPDLSLSSSADHDGYLICSGGDCVNGFRNTDTTLDVAGGTSVAAPSFAGVIALLNQHTGTIQGNINLVLYPLAAATTNVFHDIFEGDNRVPCTTGSTDCPNGGPIGYYAGPGYDLATGLGSFDAANLVNEWTSVNPSTGNTGTPDFNFTLSPSTLSIARGTSGTSSAAISSLNAFNGTVVFTCQIPSSLGGVTCGASGAVVGSGTATIQVTAASNAGFMNWPSIPNIWSRTAIPIAGSCLLLAFFLWRRRQNEITFRHTSLAAGVLAVTLLTLTACGDGQSSSTNTEKSGTITVNAIAGSIQHTATIAVTVN